MTDLVRFKNVTARRGSFELNIPSWSVPSGRVVGVVGPNGAGKTTMLRLIPGLDRVNTGSVQVFGKHPIRQLAEVRTSLGWMSDDMPVLNIRIHRLLWWVSGYYPSWDADLTRSLVDRFKLDLSSRAGDLSKGQATRLRLILAMAFRPRLLILDEPATGLDVAGRRALLASVLDVAQDAGRTVIISSHQIADLERVADWLVVVNHGRIVQNGPIDQLVQPNRTLQEHLLEWGAAGC